MDPYKSRNQPPRIIAIVGEGQKESARNKAIREALENLDYGQVEVHIIAREGILGNTFEEIYGHHPKPIEIPLLISPTGRATEYPPLEIPKDQLPKISKGKQSKFTRQPWQQHGKRRRS